jgi:hypothetical protein
MPKHSFPTEQETIQADRCGRFVFGSQSGGIEAMVSEIQKGIGMALGDAHYGWAHSSS